MMAIPTKGGCFALIVVPQFLSFIYIVQVGMVVLAYINVHAVKVNVQVIHRLLLKRHLVHGPKE